MDGKDEVARKDFIKYIGKDKRTIDKHVGDSELFELVSGASSAVIRRRR